MAKTNTIRVKLYRNYKFTGQDPACRDLCKIMEEREIPTSKLSKKSDVSNGTIRNWRTAKTMRPTHATLEAIARTMGYSFQLTETKKRSRL